MSSYISDFSNILTRPAWKYASGPVPDLPENGEEIRKIDAQVLFFVLVSLFVGFVFYSVIPDLRPEGTGVAELYGDRFSDHGKLVFVCSDRLQDMPISSRRRRLRPDCRGNAQVLSVVYVSSNYITFLIDNILISLNFVIFYKYPFIIYNLTWMIMFGYYLQEAVGSLYGLGKLERLAMVILALSFVLIGMIMVMPIGESGSFLGFLGGNPRRFPRVN